MGGCHNIPVANGGGQSENLIAVWLDITEAIYMQPRSTYLASSRRKDAKSNKPHIDKKKGAQ